MNILLTGSAGFIGSHLTESLLHKGNYVIGIDNYLSGQRSNTNIFQKHDNFRFIEIDISKQVPTISDKLDWVMHFASPASPPHYQKVPIETLMVGSRGTQNCLDLALEHKASFILASTSEVYGDPQVHPQPESYWGHVNPFGIRSCYDEAKRFAEAITMAYHRFHNVDTRIIRIFNTYGPRMRADDGRVVTNFINQALANKPLTVYGDGSQTRSFQYIDDLIAGIMLLMEVQHHEPVNVGNPDEYRILEFANKVREYVNSELTILHMPMPIDDPLQRKPDIDKARKLLDWEPLVDLKVGLEKTVTYFQNLQEALV